MKKRSDNFDYLSDHNSFSHRRFWVAALKTIGVMTLIFGAIFGGAALLSNLGWEKSDKTPGVPLSEAPYTLNNSSNHTYSEMLNYGEGVWYFPYVGAEFPNSLSQFLVKYTNLEVSAMSPNVVRLDHYGKIKAISPGGGQTDYGAAIGYFVIFREKK
ncbi:MAG: hypothetical protein V4697_02290 [Patescibacteria group bacterium]